MMASSKLLRLILGHMAYNHRTTLYHSMTHFLLSFFKKNKMKIKKTSLHNGHLITGESPTTSAKVVNAEHFEQTKSSVSKVFNV